MMTSETSDLTIAPNAVPRTMPGHVNHVATHDEFLELFQHVNLLVIGIHFRPGSSHPPSTPELILQSLKRIPLARSRQASLLRPGGGVYQRREAGLRDDPLQSLHIG